MAEQQLTGKCEELLVQIEAALDTMLLGRTPDALDESAYPEECKPVVQKFNRLNHDLTAAIQFTKDISKGDLDTDPPGRSNFLAAGGKEIHSQLISFCWSIEQLMRGNMVSKLYYPGELFESYNKLIEKVSSTLGKDDAADSAQWGSTTVTSWRYHQILSAINQLRIMVLEVNAKGEVLFANLSAQQIFPEMHSLPYNNQALQNQALLTYLCTFSDYATNLDAKHTAFTDLPAPVRSEVYDTDHDTWYKITSDLVKLTDGTFGILHMIDNITEWKNRERQLKLGSTIDTLTSTYTRKAGFAKAAELVRQRHVETNCAVFIDLDGLKKINDNYGHTEGDFAIKTVAEILLSSVRDVDWVIRYGGDEFLVLFVGCTEDTARRIVDRMYAKCKAVNKQINKPYTLAFSVGLSAITPEMEDVSDLIERIDQYMYEDKQSRNAQRIN